MTARANNHRTAAIVVWPRCLVPAVGEEFSCAAMQAPEAVQAANGEAASGELEVTLGRAQKAHMVVADNAVWKELLAVVAKFDATHAGRLPCRRIFGKRATSFQLYRSSSETSRHPSGMALLPAAPTNAPYMRATSAEITQRGVLPNTSCE